MLWQKRIFKAQLVVFKLLCFFSLKCCLRILEDSILICIANLYVIFFFKKGSPPTARALFKCFISHTNLIFSFILFFRNACLTKMFLGIQSLFFRCQSYVICRDEIFNLFCHRPLAAFFLQIKYKYR